MTFDSNTANRGSAIYSTNTIVDVKNSTFKNNIASSIGGAIRLDVSKYNNSNNLGYESTILNSTFTKNKATQGGAIYVYKSGTSKNHLLTVVDSTFDGNSGTGGAIYSQINLNVFAETKDVKFATKGDDVYLYHTSALPVMNVAASDGKKVIFNGEVKAYKAYSELNINKTGMTYKDANNTIKNMTSTGEIQFNNKVNNMNINLYAGTLSIGQGETKSDNYLDKSKLFIKGDSILNTINDNIGEVNSKIEIDSGINWEYNFDVDMKNESADKLIVSDNQGSVTLSKINFLSSDSEKDDFKITIADKNINASLSDTYSTLVTSSKTYWVFADNDDNGSYLSFEIEKETGGLANAVAGKASQYVNTSGQDEVVDVWNKRVNEVVVDMVIDGNGQNLITNTNVEGLVAGETGNAITLTIDDVAEIKGFNNALTVSEGSILNINNTSFSENTGNAVITNEKGTVYLNATANNINIDKGSATNAILSTGGEINLAGTNNININGNVNVADSTIKVATNTLINGDISTTNSKLNILSNAEFNGNITGSNNSEINISSDVAFNSNIDGMNVNQKQDANVSIQGFNNGDYSIMDSTLTVNDTFNGKEVLIGNSTVNLLSNLSAEALYISGAEINMANGTINSVNVQDLFLSTNSNSNFTLDVDLLNEQMDKLHAGNVDMFSTFTSSSSTTPTINITSFNYISDTTKPKLSINFTSTPELQSAVYTNITSYMNKLYKYAVSYDPTTGNFNFVAGSSNNYNSLNPSVVASSVAAQMGGYLNQLNSYDQAFRNMDMYMLMTKAQRQAMKNANKYAAADSSLVYDPINTPYSNAAGWFRPFTTMESVGLKNGPKVDNTAYGTYAGLDSELVELGHGWDAMASVYAGYNGSHQKYQGNSIYQNGGTLGLVGMAYKDNFFTGLTANVGSNIADANTMYGSEDFTMLMTGIASKTGYNWELADGKFIIQPSYMMSYSMVNTFDYTNGAGVRINSDPLHAIQIEPGVKFIGNLKNGWQPYAGVSVVMNIMDDTKFKANDVSLPELSVKPYAKYGVGVRKSWGERFTGFFQTFITSGGRNGVGLQGGFRWTLGKSKSKKTKVNSIGEKKYIKAKV